MRRDLPFSRRRAGVLLHPTSLPGRLGGDIGPDAFRFVDWLAEAGMSVWQMLPHGPTHEDLSPYQCLSVHAGNPLWIALDGLVEQGWLMSAEPDDPTVPVAQWRLACLRRAREGFARQASEAMHDRYRGFVRGAGHWLEDFAVYMAVRGEQDGRTWREWPAPLRDRAAAALDEARVRLADEIEHIRFQQFLFHEQWAALKHYANDKGVWLFGDLPIYVAHDSAEVWAAREQFDLDAKGGAVTVAGVPPDYFSATGQRWGNPHYRWAHMQADGFGWWRQRLRHSLALYDLVRIDHFRGFEAYWSIPVEAETAVEGHWVKAPGEALFETLRAEFGELPLVAEDLGIITPEVDALRRRFGLPGMKILQFAFDSGADNPYLPHNHEIHSVVYTGTHDNDTTVGWFLQRSPQAQQHVLEYLGLPNEVMPWPLLRAALASVAQLAVIPLQDALALDSEHRMNTPGTAQGNWRWRFDWNQVPAELAGRLRAMVEMYGR